MQKRTNRPFPVEFFRQQGGIARRWLQMPGECEERLSDSVAPEHLRGSWQPGSMHRGALPTAGGTLM
jgi:hypothetical protein